MKKRKATEAATKRQSDYNTTDSAEQQQRTLAALQQAGPDGVTTIQARDELNVMHPAARIQELRDAGHQIETIWTASTNTQGHVHRNARYVLIHLAEEVSQ